MSVRDLQQVCNADSADKIHFKVHANVTIQAHQANVHSGVGGGSVAEPLLDMSRLLASLMTSDRSVAIPGFSDAVRPLEEEEEKVYKEVINRTTP